jgi:Leucine-rich repeat (LRR) protein
MKVPQRPKVIPMDLFIQARIEKSRITGVLLVSNMGLEELPELPPNLTHLYCWSNKLRHLRDLPKSLTHLYCGGNYLTELPELPAGLSHLYFLENNIKVLPRIPPNLKELYCDSNNLTSLPNLEHLEVLSCSKNSLASLPDLPALTTLYCEENPWDTNFNNILNSENQIHSMKRYHTHMKLKQRAQDLLALKHTLRRKEILPEDIINIVGFQLSGENIRLDSQINNLFAKLV